MDTGWREDEEQEQDSLNSDEGTNLQTNSAKHPLQHPYRF